MPQQPYSGPSYGDVETCRPHFNILYDSLDCVILEAYCLFKRAATFKSCDASC